MSIKILLDDAATEAMAGRRVEVGRAYLRADQRRTLVRWRASAVLASAVAIAATVALVAFLLPGSMSRAFTGAPAAREGRRFGIAGEQHYAPPWTPSVTRHPMAAASMVLQTPIAVGAHSVEGPVLASADGKQYASVPWSKWDSQVALSADGSEVAWVSQGSSAGTGPARAVVHWIELQDGHQQDAKLSPGMSVSQLLWAGAELYIVAASSPGRPGVWRLDPGSSTPHELCRCGPVLLGSSPAGTLVQAVSPQSPESALLPGVPEADLPAALPIDRSVQAPRIASPGLVVDPTGRQTASLIASPPASGSGPQAYSVQSGRVTPYPTRHTRDTSAGTAVMIQDVGKIIDLHLLGWAPGGIIVQVRSFDGHFHRVSLFLYRPGGGQLTMIGQRLSFSNYPVAVAAAVVGNGQPIPSGPMVFPTFDRSYLRFLLIRGWVKLGHEVELLALVLVIGLAFWLRRRRANRKIGQAIAT